MPQHGVPGGSGQRDMVEPRLRPEGVPVALHHVRQGQDVGVEVAVVELSELPPHEIGGVDGQPVVLCAHRLPSQHASWQCCSHTAGISHASAPQTWAACAVFERPSLGRAQLQLGVKRGHQRKSSGCLWVQALRSSIMQACGEDVHAVHEPKV